MIVSPIESITMESLSEAQRVANTRAMLGLLETAPFDDVEQLVPVSDMRLKVGAAGNTALHAAVKMDRSDCIGVFAPLSDMSARNRQGWTPLQMAAAEGREDCLAALLSFFSAASARGLLEEARLLAVEVGNSGCAGMLAQRLEPKRPAPSSRRVCRARAGA